MMEETTDGLMDSSRERNEHVIAIIDSVLTILDLGGGDDEVQD